MKITIMAQLCEKLRKFFFLLGVSLWAALLFSGCREDEENWSRDDGYINFVFTLSEAITRADIDDETGAGNFEKGDAFTLTVSGESYLFWDDLHLAENVMNVKFSGH